MEENPAIQSVSGPAERTYLIREMCCDEHGRVWIGEDYGQDLLPHGSLVFLNRTEVIEWLRGEGLVVLDKQQAETVRAQIAFDESHDDMCLLPVDDPDYDPCYDCAALALLSAGEGPK